MDRLTLNAPSKINLGLNIVSKRDDGFHNLETFFYPIYDLQDKLIFESNDYFIFDSNNTNLLKDPANLILKAHTIISDHVNEKLSLKITLIKNIPIGAGLGGGSSDAAATLLGLNEFFRLNISIDKLKEFALQLGSDVPFFIHSKPAVGTSRGEILKLSNISIDNPILIINPTIHISTKEAFSHIVPNESEFDYNYFLKNTNIDLNFLRKNLNNDFEKNIFNSYPEIKEIKSMLYENGALFALMSGTGSTVYGIFDDLDNSERFKEKLPKHYFSFISHY